MDVDQRMAYMLLILIGTALNKYNAVLLELNQSEKDLAGDKWTLGKMKGLSTDNLWTWIKIDGVGYE